MHLFEQIRRIYVRKHDLSIQIIDSTFIMNKFGKNKIARNKFFKNKNCNKISLVTDIHGVPLSVLFDTGNVHDLSFVTKHVSDINNISSEKFILLADKGYVSNKLKLQLVDRKCTFIFPPKRNMKQVHMDKVLYKKRIYVEHTFATLKQFKRVIIRTDSFIKTYKSFVYLALSLMIHRKLH
jgi:transposase